MITGPGERGHHPGHGAADPEAPGGDAAGHGRVRQPAAAHHRHLHQGRHLGTRSPFSHRTQSFSPLLYFVL